MSLTQQDIADHLDLSQKAVSQFLEQNKIDWMVSSLDEIRVAYIQNLRAQAAGHRSQDGLDLVRERVLSERIDRELKQFTLAEKKGTLINVAQLEPELQQMVGAFRIELLSRDDKLKSALDALHGIDIDIQLLNDHTYAALKHLARYDPGRAPDGRTAGVDDGAAGKNHADTMGV